MAKFRTTGGATTTFGLFGPCKNRERSGLGCHCKDWPKLPPKRKEWHPPAELLVPAGKTITPTIIEEAVASHNMGQEPIEPVAKKSWWKRLWNYLFGSN